MNVCRSIKKYYVPYCFCTFSVFFQFPANSSDHFLLPFYEAIGLRYTDQYSSYDYNQVPAGTCFQQSIIAGEYYLVNSIIRQAVLSRGIVCTFIYIFEIRNISVIANKSSVYFIYISKEQLCSQIE